MKGTLILQDLEYEEEKQTNEKVRENYKKLINIVKNVNWQNWVKIEVGKS